jgi:hypothetical protein
MMEKTTGVTYGTASFTIFSGMTMNDWGGYFWRCFGCGNISRQLVVSPSVFEITEKGK